MFYLIISRHGKPCDLSALDLTCVTSPSILLVPCEAHYYLFFFIRIMSIVCMNRLSNACISPSVTCLKKRLRTYSIKIAYLLFPSFHIVGNKKYYYFTDVFDRLMQIYRSKAIFVINN